MPITIPEEQDVKFVLTVFAAQTYARADVDLEASVSRIWAPSTKADSVVAGGTVCNLSEAVPPSDYQRGKMK
jgi:hypothetical protein